MGNCDHQQCQFSIENIENFNDFGETIDKFDDFEETIDNFNGFEETIENFNGFGGHHCHGMFFGTRTIDNNGFSMVLGLLNHWFQWFPMVKDHWSTDGMV